VWLLHHSAETALSPKPSVSKAVANFGDGSPMVAKRIPMKTACVLAATATAKARIIHARWDVMRRARAFRTSFRMHKPMKAAKPNRTTLSAVVAKGPVG
jgi:hypothetical protein